MTGNTAATLQVSQRQIWEFMALVLAIVAGAGCSANDRQRQGPASGHAAPENGEAVEPAAAAEESVLGESRSATCLLTLKDLAGFRPGRSKGEILEDIQWRGNFEMSTRHEGKIITAISYNVAGEPLGEGPIGTEFWAVFVDEKFEKLGPWPSWGDKRAFKLGDFSLLIQASESEPINISDLKDSLHVDSEAPAQVDPGLTAVWLRLRKGVEAAHQRDLKRNAVLRDQFNASRLNIGMTLAEVESVLKARPIESGQVEAGTFHIYGSTESLDALEVLHYHNILILIEDGRVSGIYSGSMVRGGKHGLEQMREWFVDLPPRERAE